MRTSRAGDRPAAEGLCAHAERLELPLDSEEFKRVDLAPFAPTTITSAPAAPPSSTAKFATLLANRAKFSGSVAQIDGSGTQAVLDEKLVRQGVLFGDLSSLVREHRAVLEPHFLTRAVRPSADRFAAWHAAFWTGGTVLYVPRNVQIDEPLHSLIGLSEAKGADFSHTLVVLEEGSAATLLEETASADQSVRACTSAPWNC